MEATAPGPTAPPAEPQKAPEAATPAPASKPAKADKKKKGSCLKGCLIFFVVILLVVGGIVANALGLFQKWGLVKSRAEKVFTTEAPDYGAAEDLKTEVQAAGIDTKGMDVVVLPKRDGTGAAAVVVLDSSKGFSFHSTQGGDPFLDTLGSMAKSEAVKKNGIGAVAFEYKDGSGRPLVTFGASVQDAADFADGKLTREQFAARVGGKLNFNNLVKAEQESVK